MGLFDKFRKKARPRAVVLGLDGVPYSLLRDLKSRGRIPNMASIFEQGSFNQMSVAIPEISSVSWSSFMTGTQAGEHGIYGFMDLEPGTYKMYFPNFTHLKAPPKDEGANAPSENLDIFFDSLAYSADGFPIRWPIPIQTIPKKRARA